MKSQKIIRGTISIILLVVFALGITPKQVLHDILTDHEHVPHVGNAGAWLGKDRYNCDDENFAAESPFVLQISVEFNHLQAAWQVSKSCYFPSYSFLHLFFFELRGPPSLA